MGLIVFIACIICCYYLKAKKNSSDKNCGTNYGDNQKQNANCNITNTSGNTYRPVTSKSKNSSIIFKSEYLASKKTSKTDSYYNTDLTGLHDAFTGAPLNKNIGLYQCQICKLYYHHKSFETLTLENNSKCVGCEQQDIIKVDFDKNHKSKLIVAK